MILSIALAAATAVCGAGWIVTRIKYEVVTLYILQKGCEPTAEELKSCSEAVIRKKLGLKA